MDQRVRPIGICSNPFFGMSPRTANWTSSAVRITTPRKRTAECNIRIWTVACCISADPVGSIKKPANGEEISRSTEPPRQQSLTAREFDRQRFKKIEHPLNMTPLSATTRPFKPAAQPSDSLRMDWKSDNSRRFDCSEPGLRHASRC